MDKAAFADTDSEPWWLLGTVIEPILVDRRKDLGQVLGYDRDSEWYGESWKLESFYDLLESKFRLLLAELDEATDVTKQSEWLEKVIALLRPEKPDQAVPAGHAATSTPARGSQSTAAQPTTWKAAQPRDGAEPRRDIFGHARAEAAAGVDRTVQQVMASQLADTNYPALAAQLGLTEQQVAELLQQLPEDFEQLVAQRAAQIVASRA